jgi:hypothetical protein
LAEKLPVDAQNIGHASLPGKQSKRPARRPTSSSMLNDIFAVESVWSSAEILAKFFTELPESLKG